MKPEQLRKLIRIIDEYGSDKQQDIAIEECSELIKAICKYKRTLDHVEDNLKSSLIAVVKLKTGLNIKSTDSLNGLKRIFLDEMFVHAAYLSYITLILCVSRTL